MADDAVCSYPAYNKSDGASLDRRNDWENSNFTIKITKHITRIFYLAFLYGVNAKLTIKNKN
ncbi:hypothetical protein OAP06_00985 [Gammaproteobacteria bacterium]|nr:hypothetical protein [Gammaproteobacteria bacterium]